MSEFPIKPLAQHVVIKIEGVVSAESEVAKPTIKTINSKTIISIGDGVEGLNEGDNVITTPHCQGVEIKLADNELSFERLADRRAKAKEVPSKKAKEFKIISYEVIHSLDIIAIDNRDVE